MRSMAIQEDGKLIFAGQFQTVDDQLIKNLARINPDGTLDESFNPPDLGDREIYDIAVSPSNKILLRQDRNPDLIVLNADGSIDDSYVEDASLSTKYKIAINGDKYLMVSNTSEGINLLQVNNDGSLDDSFAPADLGGGTLFYEIEILNDGKIFLSGGFTKFNEHDLTGIVRINADGTLDDTFNPGSGPDGLNKLIYDFIVQEDGKIVAVGSFTSFNGVETPAGLVRLNTDGSVDETFISTVAANHSTSNFQINQQADGKLIIGGQTKVFRLNSDGSFDNTYSVIELNQGFFVNSYVMVQGDEDKNYIVSAIVGINDSFQLGFLASDKDGNVLDVDPKIGGLPIIQDVAKQEDGKIIVVGTIYGVGDQDAFGIIRLNEDGSLDDSFAPNIDFSNSDNSRLSSIGIQSDGKIVVGGYFTNIPGSYRLIRLLPDGTLDESFQANVQGSFSDQGVSEIIVGENDELFIGGSISFANGVSLRNFVKLNADGTSFANFTTDVLTVDHRVNSIAITSDGKILIGGSYQHNTGFIFMLDENGALDDSFNNQEDLANVVNVVSILGDRILLGGESRSGGSVDRPIFMVQLDMSGNIIDEGSIAVSHATQTGDYRDILSFETEQDMIIGGAIDHVNSIEKGGIARISPNGAFHSNFPFDVKGIVNKVISYDDEHLLVFGLIERANTTRILGAAKLRLTNDVPIITGAEELSTNEDEPLELTLDALTVTDIDDIFPDDFSLIVNEGENYSVQGTTITPSSNFNGDLVVKIKVNDGEDDSPVFDLPISVLPVNDAPEITGITEELSTPEDTPIEITLANLTVDDPDNDFPEDFSLSVLEGSNYTFEGALITPSADFNGDLSVVVSVNDGELDSEQFTLPISVTPVNDKPVITGLAGELSTLVETSITLELPDFAVSDPDNTYPDDFTLIVLEGENYTLDGNTITPAAGFEGNLTVPVKVNDGNLDSDTFEAAIAVVSNVKPIITGTTRTLTTDSETPLTIELTDLSVTDPDNTYPDDFTLTVMDGDNYTVDDNTITPDSEFVGNLLVPVTVNDGIVDSDIFEITVEVSMVTSIDLEEVSNSITISPNPGDSELKVVLDNEIYQQVNIRLVKVTGEKILGGSFEKNQKVFEKRFDVRQLSSGLYLVLITQGDTYGVVKRFIKP